MPVYLEKELPTGEFYTLPRRLSKIPNLTHTCTQFDGSEKSNPINTSTNLHPVHPWRMKCSREVGSTPVRKIVCWNWLIVAWKFYQVPCDGCDAAMHLTKEAPNPDQWHSWRSFRLDESCFFHHSRHRGKRRTLVSPRVLSSRACCGLEALGSILGCNF